MFIRGVCYRCRTFNCYDDSHAQFRFATGYKWRMPKKSNDKAWKEIEKGNYWWDLKAIAKKAIKQAERIRRSEIRRKYRKGNYES